VLGEVVGSTAMLGCQNLGGGNCSLLGIIYEAVASSGNSIIIIVYMAAQNLGEKLDVKHKVQRS